MRPVIGLDIGGANLKAVHSDGRAVSLPFALWREPQSLGKHLLQLLEPLPPAERYAVTMTGELCDCFASQSEGVLTILEHVQNALPGKSVLVWSIQGSFTPLEDARTRPKLYAATNWLAQATLAARFVPNRSALLIDIGSTTTDIIPLFNGRPDPRGKTDFERMQAGELVYTGARRTPVCAVLGPEVAAELFATMADVYLVLGESPEEPERSDTADGRPMTKTHSHARLARMLCEDPATFPREATLSLAVRARDAQVKHLLGAVRKVHGAMPARAESILVSGSGAFVLQHVRPHLDKGTWIDLSEHWGSERSTCACAWAVAKLLSDGAYD